MEVRARQGSMKGPDLPLRDGSFETSGLFGFLADGLELQHSQADLAHAVHDSLARSFCGAARKLVETGHAKAVVLSGGCFQNALLTGLCLEYLQGIPVITHHHVPANDGGLALGQALIAAARFL